MFNSHRFDTPLVRVLIDVTMATLAIISTGRRRRRPPARAIRRSPARPHARRRRRRRRRHRGRRRRSVWVTVSPIGATKKPRRRRARAHALSPCLRAAVSSRRVCSDVAAVRAHHHPRRDSRAARTRLHTNIQVICRASNAKKKKESSAAMAPPSDHRSFFIRVSLALRRFFAFTSSVVVVVVVVVVRARRLHTRRLVGPLAVLAPPFRCHRRRPPPSSGGVELRLFVVAAVTVGRLVEKRRVRGRAPYRRLHGLRASTAVVASIEVFKR